MYSVCGFPLFSLANSACPIYAIHDPFIGVANSCFLLLIYLIHYVCMSFSSSSFWGSAFYLLPLFLNACLHLCIYIHTHIYTYTYMHICFHIHTRIQTH